MDQLVASFPKNKFEEVRVSVKEFKGQDFLDIRIYASTKEGEDRIPTGKGIWLSASHCVELKKAFLEAEKVLRVGGLSHE